MIMEKYGKITLHHGDCMDVMKELPDKSFDLAIVDPPYFSGPERRRYYGSNISSTRIKRKEYPTVDKWTVPNQEYFKELFRVSKKYIVWGCNYFEQHFNPGRIVWDKCNGGISFSDCEIAATNLFNSVRLYRYMWNGMLQGKNINEGYVMQGNKKRNERRIHPTQKPVNLYAWILQNYAKPGYKILDTHLGSGSSAIAAHELGYEFLGIEIDSTFYHGAKNRFLQEYRQLRLFQN